MNWSSFTQKQQMMIIGTVVVAVLWIFLLVHFFGPSSGRGGEAKKELAELQRKLDDARAILRQKETITSNLEQSIAKLEELAAHAPTLSDRYAWSYEYVSRCATVSHVELDNLDEITLLDRKDAAKKDAAKKDAPAQSYEISVSTRCGYNNLVELLWRMEKDNPLLRVKEVTVASVREQPQAHQVRIVLQWPAAVKIERGGK